MNELTKGELTDIYELMDISGACRLLTLKAKIRYMIDNYCEHDGEIGKDYPAEKCMKCNTMWE